MPGEATPAGQEITQMSQIAKHAHERNRNSLVWSAEFQINACEHLRAELRRHKTHVTLDLRRWYTPPDSTARPTGRGIAISARHLPEIKALVDAAIAHAEAASTERGAAA